MPPRLQQLRLVAVTEGEGRQVAERVAALAQRCPPGALLVQVRAKALEGGALAELVRAILAAARPHGARVLVNDRLDVALACGADGVHLPERGLTIEEARGLGSGALLIGCSRHSAETAARAAKDGADLIHLGPIWATPSKAGMGEPLGLAAIGRARAAIDELGSAARLVAIGGVDRVRAAHARTAGAHAVAAIRGAWEGGERLL